MAAYRFDAFKKVDDFTGINQEFERTYYPVSSLVNTNQFEFNIGASSRNFMDLSKSRLTLDIAVTKENGDKLVKDKDLVAPIANSGHSVFKSLDVLLNSTSLNSGENVHYAYRSYLHSILTKDKMWEESCGKIESYFCDSPASHDSNDVKSTSNVGLRERWYQIRNTGGRFQVSIYLTSDIFLMEEYLCPGVGIYLKFTLHRPEFYLITSQDERYKYQIDNAVLYMSYLSVNENISVAYERAIAREPALFKYPRTDTKSFVLPQGSTTASLDQIITHGPFDTMTLTFIPNSKYGGEYKSTPLHFPHYNLDFCALSWEGTLVTGLAFSPRFNKKSTTSAFTTGDEVEVDTPPAVAPDPTPLDVEHYVDIYSQLFQHEGNKNRGSLITPSHFKNGYFIIKYNMPKQPKTTSPAGSGLQSLARISLKFGEPLPEAVTVLLITTTSSYLAIDKDRNVILHPEVAYPKKFR